MTQEKYMKFVFRFTKGAVGTGLARCLCVRSLHAPWRPVWPLTPDPLWRPAWPLTPDLAQKTFAHCGPRCVPRIAACSPLRSGLLYGFLVILTCNQRGFEFEPLSLIIKVTHICCRNYQKFSKV